MARRVISSGKDVQETDQSGGRRSGRSISSEHAEGRSIEGYADRSKAEGFVDARRLQSEDLVSKTLQETTGTIGIMTRPKVVDFGERLKERRQAGRASHSPARAHRSCRSRGFGSCRLAVPLLVGVPFGARQHQRGRRQRMGE